MMYSFNRKPKNIIVDIASSWNYNWKGWFFFSQVFTRTRWTKRRTRNGRRTRYWQWDTRMADGRNLITIAGVEIFGCWPTPSPSSATSTILTSSSESNFLINCLISSISFTAWISIFFSLNRILIIDDKIFQLISFEIFDEINGELFFIARLHSLNRYFFPRIFLDWKIIQNIRSKLL